MNATLIEYWGLLRERWRWVMWGVLLVLAATTIALFLWPPLYRSQATVFVRTPGDVSQVQDGGDLYAQGRAQTYAALANNKTLMTRVIGDLGLAITPEELSGRIQASHPSGTALIKIAASAPSGDEARRTLQVLLAEYTTTVQGLESVPGALVPRAELVVIDEPGAPARIVAGGVPLTAVILGATLFGLFAGATAAVLSSILRPSGSDSHTEKAAVGSANGHSPERQPTHMNEGTPWT